MEAPTALGVSAFIEVNRTFFDHRSLEHEVGSMEAVVSKLIKNWDPWLHSIPSVVNISLFCHVLLIRMHQGYRRDHFGLEPFERRWFCGYLLEFEGSALPRQWKLITLQMYICGRPWTLTSSRQDLWQVVQLHPIHFLDR